MMPPAPVPPFHALFEMGDVSDPLPGTSSPAQMPTKVKIALVDALRLADQYCKEKYDTHTGGSTLEYWAGRQGEFSYAAQWLKGQP